MNAWVELFRDTFHLAVHGEMGSWMRGWDYYMGWFFLIITAIFWTVVRAHRFRNHANRNLI